MSRLNAVIIATFFFTNLAVANEPTISSAPAPIAHQWQKNADLVIGHIRSTTLNRMKNTTADIISCFRDSILTQGEFSPVWHGEYFPAVNGGPQVRFGVRCIFYNNNEDSTQNSNNDLTVFANDISPLLGHVKLNFTEYTTVKTAGDQGYYEFDMANGLHVKAWLITADSTSSPYIAVSRKEYLQEAKKELDALKDIVISDDRGRIHIRTAAEQEAEKQQMLQQLRSTYSGVELETRTRIYLNNYTKDPDLLIQTIARDVAGYNKTIRVIDSILRNSTAQDLAKPAVVSVDATHFRGFEDGHANTTTLVRMNPNYFTGSADQAPKCLLVCWRYNPAESLATGIDRQLSENFDGQQLQALLVK
jgi:hypothetical protein